MKSLLRPAVSLFFTLLLVTGVAYPAIVTALGQAAFSHRANGSLIERDGRVVGSELIGQQFDSPRYFWGRLSATTPNAYNAGSSGGSNLGPTNPALADEIKSRIEALRDADSGRSADVPVDLVTSSGSGLDPEISPAAADFQVERVAQARGLAASQVSALVERFTSGRQFGMLGEARVNVLKLNLALDDLK